MYSKNILLACLVIIIILIIIYWNIWGKESFIIGGDYGGALSVNAFPGDEGINPIDISREFRDPAGELSGGSEYKYDINIIRDKPGSLGDIKSQSNKPMANFIYKQNAIPHNYLTPEQVSELDTDVLRSIRLDPIFRPPSKSFEIDYFQMSVIITELQGYEVELMEDADLDKEITSTEIKKKEDLSDKVFWNYLLLVIMSRINQQILKKEFYIPYHKYKLLAVEKFKFIRAGWSKGSGDKELVVILNLGRDGYQNFQLYLDLVLSKVAENKWKLMVRTAEVIGLPMQKTLFKSLAIPNRSSAPITVTELRSVPKSQWFDQTNMRIFDDKPDMDSRIFDVDYQLEKVADKRRSWAVQSLEDKSRCFGYVGGENKELVYGNQLFCESYHDDIKQNGVWDSPCQIDTDCPFYRANKNYENDFGKCDKATGYCQMPEGVQALGFKKYVKPEFVRKAGGGNGEAKCYNCSGMTDNCCMDQWVASKLPDSKLASPDFVFANDTAQRKENRSALIARDLKVEPSLI